MFAIVAIIVCIWCLIEAVFAIFCGLTAPLFKLIGNGIAWLICWIIGSIFFVLGVIFYVIPAKILDRILGRKKHSKKEASDANDYNYDFYQLDSYTQDLIRQARRNNFTCVHNGKDLLHVEDFLA